MNRFIARLKMRPSGNFLYLSGIASFSSMYIIQHDNEGSLDIFSEGIRLSSSMAL